ncbi:MAG: heparinase II/III family protein [Victivallales bacterium]|nr:heparinase II/III family protein [Victivallales bacterium]
MKPLGSIVVGVVMLFCVRVGLAAGAELTTTQKELASRPLADFRTMITPPEIPRAFDVHRSGCPVCGEAIKKHGFYAWIIDEKKPFQVKCPECGSVFPDNDYAAYFRGGGKDKSLLKGKYVDNGWGWKKPGVDGKFWFVAYYNHWMFGRRIMQMIDMSQGYAATGDRALARRALLMLDTIANRYRDYDYHTQSRYALEVDSKYNGRIWNTEWETLRMQDMINCYNRLLPFFAQPDPELEAAAGKTLAEIRHNINENLFRVSAHDLVTENNKIGGNYGAHQAVLLDIAALLRNEPGQPSSLQMVDYLTQLGPYNHPTRVAIDYAIFANIFGDGAPMESPGYNSGWLNSFTKIFRAMNNYGIDYSRRYPTTRRFFTYPAKLVVAGKFISSSGDSGKIGAQSLMTLGDVDTLRYSFATNPNPTTAALLCFLAEQDPKQRQRIPAAELAAAEKLADPQFGYRNNLLAAYGKASLQNGDPKHPAALWLVFGNYPNHRHRDVLHFELFAANAPLMPDFGYPDSASDDDPTYQPFYCNTVTHNTVLVDEHAQSDKAGIGRLLAYDPTQKIKYVAADALRAYPGRVAKYGRSLLWYEAAPGKTITLDVFRVVGGKRHDYIMHGTGREVVTNVKLTPQDGGTLAGKEVPYGYFYDDAKYRGKTGTVKNYWGYVGSAYQFLTDIRRGVLAGDATLTFPVTTQSPLIHGDPGASLTVHPVGTGDELILAQGQPPKTQKSGIDQVAFMIRRRDADKPGLTSNFVTVFESGSAANAASAITKIVTLRDSMALTALKLEFDNGEIHYLFNAEAPVRPFTADGIEFSGQCGALLLAADGAVKHAYVYNGGAIVRDGKDIVRALAALTAKVVTADLKQETVVLDRDIPSAYVAGGRAFTAGPPIDLGFQARSIEGKTLTLQDQSLIRGRFQLEQFNPGTMTAVPNPALCVYRPNGWIYAADGTTALGRMTGQGKRQITLVRPFRIDALHFNVGAKKSADLWLADLGPGDTLTFFDSAGK